MTYTSIALSSLPKRKAPEKTWSKEDADSILAILTATVEGDQPTASDGVAYADVKAARSEANKAKRLVNHVLPEGKIVASLVFGLDAKGNPVAANTAGIKAFGWALVLKDAPVEETTAKASK